MIELIFPKNNAQISLMTDVQKEFERRQKIGDTSCDWLTDTMVSGRELSDPAVVLFKWKNSDPTSPVKFDLSTDPEFSNSVYDGVIGSIHSVCASAEDSGVYFAWVDNLLVGTEYYWKVDDGSENCEVRKFSTLSGEIRRIRSANFGNIRDLGGKYNADGKYIKQGMIFRGTLLEREGFMPSSLPDETHRIMHDDMKIKTEIDLRGEGVSFEEFKHLDKSVSCLDKDVNYCYIPLKAYSSILEDSEHGPIREIFDIFAEEENYPIYFHCVAGADRTGTIAFLLEAVLGFTEDDMILDYNTTSLNVRFGSRNWKAQGETQHLLTNMRSTYPDKTINEMFVQFLLDIGVTQEKLDKIRKIMINN